MYEVTGESTGVQGFSTTSDWSGEPRSLVFFSTKLKEERMGGKEKKNVKRYMYLLVERFLRSRTKNRSQGLMRNPFYKQCFLYLSKLPRKL